MEESIWQRGKVWHSNAEVNESACGRAYFLWSMKDRGCQVNSAGNPYFYKVAWLLRLNLRCFLRRETPAPFEASFLQPFISIASPYILHLQTPYITSNDKFFLLIYQFTTRPFRTIFATYAHRACCTTSLPLPKNWQKLINVAMIMKRDFYLVQLIS